MNIFSVCMAPLRLQMQLPSLVARLFLPEVYLQPSIVCIAIPTTSATHQRLEVFWSKNEVNCCMNVVAGASFPGHSHLIPESEVT